MAHIHLPGGLPGIRSLAAFRPQTGKPLYQLAQVLLRGPSGLSTAERELIAAYVSSLNDCLFCELSHAAAARQLYGSEANIVDCVIGHEDGPTISPKLQALLVIAAKVRENGKAVLPEDIEQARQEGASDSDLHDTVLIAAAFSMFNRYVDGLGTLTPADPSEYLEMGVRLAEHGYVPPG